MNKLFKTILIILSAVFAAGLLLINPSYVQAEGITIIPEPIFNVNNFLPGQSVNSTVTIKNNSGEDYTKITLNGTKTEDTAGLSSALKLKVDDLPEVNLAWLLNKDNFLDLLGGGIGNGETKTFNFTMKFNEGGEADNKYQGQKLIFDFIFTFGGKETTRVTTVMGVFSGGSQELLIYYEEASEIGTTGAIITWETNLPAASRVICSPYPFDNFKPNFPPNYGYSYSTVEDRRMITLHSVTLDSLEPATTYFCRAISHTFSSGETVSKRLTFTTKGVAGVSTEEKEIPTSFPPVEEKPKEGIIPPVKAASEEIKQKVAEEEIVKKEVVEEKPEKKPTEVTEKPSWLTNMLAAVGNSFLGLGNFLTVCYPCFPWWIILILALYPLTQGIITWKKDRKESKIWFIWFAVLFILTICFYFLSYHWVALWVFLLLALLTLLLWWFIRIRSAGGRERFIFIGGLALLLILFVVWLIKKCLFPGLILLPFLIYYLIASLIKK